VTIPTVEVYLILGVTVLLYSFIRSYFLNDFGIFQFLRFFVAFQLTLGIRFTLLLLVFPLIVLLMHKNFQEKEQLKRQITSFVLLLTLTSVPYILVLKSEENRRQVFELTAGLASLDISAQNVFENFAIFSTNFSLIGLGLVAIFLFTKIKFRNSREARFNSLLKLLMVIQFATYITNVNGFSKYFGSFVCCNFVLSGIQFSELVFC
jgi:hypothetical protein